MTARRGEQRRAFTHVGGPTTDHGDLDVCRELRRAFSVGEEDAEATRAHVHGFHSYPARLHPTIARRLLESFAGPGAVVLDPFCGSGTVLVEARLRGHRARGTDVNPLALRLAQLKVRGVPEVDRKELLRLAARIEEHVTARRVGRARISHRYPPEDVRLFAPHVLHELDALRDGLDHVVAKDTREDLELVFSAILTKASRQRGDTGNYLLPERRLAPGAVARLFVRKTEELVERLAAFEALLPPDAPVADVHADDARVLGTLGAGSVQCVITSPPYAATYDYLDHHDVRLRWLRLREDRFASLELGARRDYAPLPPETARARWTGELGGFLSALSRALSPGGQAFVVIADSAVGRLPLRADELLDQLGPPRGLAVVARVSQARPHFHGATRAAFARAPRREHLVCLRRSVVAPSGPEGAAPSS